MHNLWKIVKLVSETRFLMDWVYMVVWILTEAISLLEKHNSSQVKNEVAIPSTVQGFFLSLFGKNSWSAYFVYWGLVLEHGIIKPLKQSHFVCIFSRLFCIHFLRCCQGEFVNTIILWSLVGGHFLYSQDIDVEFSGNIVRRN